MNYRWSTVPFVLRDAIESDIGHVRTASPLEWMRSVPMVAVLRTRTHRAVVVKAAPESHISGAEYLRREAVAAPRVAELATQMLGTYQVGGWVANITAFHRARFVNLSPESPDLPRVARALDAARRTHYGSPLPSLSDRWSDVLSADDRHLLRGQFLLHTNLHPTNLSIYSALSVPRVHIVGWGRAVLGPRWAEFTLFYRQLRRAGHTPSGAVAWLHQFPEWRTAALPERVTALARAMQLGASRHDHDIWAELVSPPAR